MSHKINNQPLTSNAEAQILLELLKPKEPNQAQLLAYERLSLLLANLLPK